jgi:hypothetical protein
MQQTLAEIVDASGAVMLTSMLTEQKPYLFTEDLPAGLYLLRLVNRQGFVSTRFVKQLN